MDKKDKWILGVGTVLVMLMLALLYSTVTSPVGGKEKVIVQTKYVFDTLVTPATVRIEKVKLKETVVIEKEDSAKIRKLINVVDSLEKEVVLYGSTKKLSLDTIIQPSGDTVKLVIDKYRNLVDTLCVKSKPIRVQVLGETKTIMLPPANKSLWIAGALGAATATLLILIFGR